MDRRNFLKKMACTSLYGGSAATMLGKMNLAQAAALNYPNEYRALVCVFLFGGNDAFNMLIPRTNEAYNVYAATRQNLAVAQDQLLPINPANEMSEQYGLHPQMPGVQRLFNEGKLSLVANVGALIEPTTKQQFLNNSVLLPPRLFSHNDQQDFVMSLETVQPFQGWASRMSDLLIDVNANPQLSMNITMTGMNTWQGGGVSSPYTMSHTGVNSIWGINFESDNPWATHRADAFLSLLNHEHQHVFAREHAALQARSINIGSQMKAALETVPALETSFNPASRLALQLKMVAQVIAAQQQLGMRRQIFFVGFGGFDTHGSQLAHHPDLLQELSGALESFYNATVELGVDQQVTTFTSSDFGRTLTSNGDGTDHGWGGHQMVIGSAVDGGKIFGTMPNLELDSEDDVGRGRIVPTLSIDQYAATLANWYGVSSSDQLELFPHLRNFNESSIPFIRS